MISVSIIDADIMARKSLCGVIRNSGRYKCISTYQDSSSARKGLPIEQPRVVIFDPHVAQGSMMDCIRWLKRRLIGTEFLAFAGHCDSKTVLDAVHAGVTGYISKRVGPERMIAALDELTSGGSPVSASAARAIIQAFTKPRLFPKNLPATLTRREEEILAELVKGRMLKEITTTLDISQGTVNTHMRNLYRKLEVNSRQEIMIRYFSAGNSPHFPSVSHSGKTSAGPGPSPRRHAAGA